MIKLIEPEEMIGSERDILLIREMWQKYASPQFTDLLDTDPVAPEAMAGRRPLVDPDAIRMEPPEVEDPKKRLRDILGDDS